MEAGGGEKLRERSRRPGVVGFRELFQAELAGPIARRRGGLGSETSDPESAFDLGLAGLALSGGGIRSATFNLGLLQALAAGGILERCDYLSTVSGGGYIGSSLTSLCSEEPAGVTRETFPFRHEGAVERAEVRHLRSHGNYLALRHGVLRLDTWRLVSTYVGGLLLTLATAGAILAASSAAGLWLLAALVQGIERALGWSPPGAPDLWEAPREHARALYAPLVLPLGLWALGGLGYVAASVRDKLWSLAFRAKLTRAQGVCLLAAAVLAALGSIPFILQGVHALVENRLGLATSTAVVSIASLLASRLLGTGGRKLSGGLKRGLFVLGAWIFVALFFVAVVYVVWRWRDGLWLIFLPSALLLSILAVFTDINRVSMFYFYRDRLSEAFIIRRARDPEAKRPIESNDKLSLSALAERPPRAPYHLINAAVNLAGSDELKRQGRKADFFLLSPLFAGSEVTGYVPTRGYEGNRVTLASAMAVSGAATNPQYGRTTHPAFAFLMALLNVRLGVWAQNPCNCRVQAGPESRAGSLARQVRRFWPYYLVMELLRLSHEKRFHINLSDGGHIENLGVYELLRRRCRLIIASDAGADPEWSFADLGNVIRLARIDLGVQIQLEESEVAKLKPNPDSRLSEAHAVLGEVRYPPRDGKEQLGQIVYVKSSLTAGDPPDLHEYGRRHAAFPHQSTADQFFDEDQFEAYRELGYRAGVAAREIVQKL